jgi:Concanavalin A-like lectin/glucanases superfamily
MGSPSAADPYVVDVSGRDALATISGSASQTLSTLYMTTTGYARTDGAAVNSANSFTVSAWVWLDGTGSTHQTVVSQQATAYCAFYLRYNPDGKWHLELLNNINGGSFTIASAVSSVNAASRTWVHLVGVYDKATGQGRIYVNGSPSGSTSVPSGVAASGRIIMGAGWSGGSWQDRLSGNIDDIWLWERPLSDAEIAQLYANGH